MLSCFDVIRESRQAGNLAKVISQHVLWSSGADLIETYAIQLSRQAHASRQESHRTNIIIISVVTGGGGQLGAVASQPSEESVLRLT
jgi:hypothetical protein